MYYIRVIGAWAISDIIKMASKSFKFGKINLKIDCNGNKAKNTKNTPIKKHIMFNCFIFLNS